MHVYELEANEGLHVKSVHLAPAEMAGEVLHFIPVKGTGRVSRAGVVQAQTLWAGVAAGDNMQTNIQYEVPLI